MRKSKLTSLFLVMLMLLLCTALMVSADPATVAVTGNSPANESVSTNNVLFNITVTGNESTYTCTLYTNESGTWASREVDTAIANDTATAFTARTITESALYNYVWNVNCTSATNTTGSFITGTVSNTSHAINPYYFGVDDTAPVVSFAGPADRFWDTDGFINLSLIINDTNANNCTLYTTMNTSNNLTHDMRAYAPLGYTTNTVFTFTGFDTLATKMADNNTGAYLWNFTCDDLAGNTVSVSNRIIYVDTVSPTGFVFDYTKFLTDNAVTWKNNTWCTDYTPAVGWNGSNDVNFSHYSLKLYGQVCLNSTNFEVNISSAAVLTLNSSLLNGDIDYYIGVQAVDMAGNTVDINGNCSNIYRAKSVGRALNSGWNIMPQLGNAVAASALLTQTGATTIAYLNNTHQFDSYASGGVSFTVPAGRPFFAYMAATGNWSDLVFNETAHGTTSTLRNESNTQWNIVIDLNKTVSNTYNMTQLDYYLNIGNTTLGTTGNNFSNFVFYNNSGSTNTKYIDYRTNWSFNNQISTTYGDPLWILNKALTNTTNELSLDWSTVRDLG